MFRKDPSLGMLFLLAVAAVLYEKASRHWPPGGGVGGGGSAAAPALGLPDLGWLSAAGRAGLVMALAGAGAVLAGQGLRLAATLGARARRVAELETVEIVLSRDDTTEPFEVMAFFDHLHGLLAARFVGLVAGQPWAVWELAKKPGDLVRFYLTAPGRVMGYVQARLQATYQNVRFAPATDRPKAHYLYAQQFRLAEHWSLGLKSLKNYQNLISESMVAALDRAEAEVRLQFVLIPAGVTAREIKGRVRYVEGAAQRRRAGDAGDPGVGYVENKEFNRMLEAVGKKLFAVEIRLASDDWPSAQALVGCMKEASGDNELIPSVVLLGRRWWFRWVRDRSPGWGPLVRRMRMASVSLATLMQLPSVRSRVPLNRFPVRRGPAQRTVPRVTSAAEAVMRDEVGYLDFDPAERRYGLLLLGVPGVGKSTTLLRLFAKDARDRRKCIILKDPKGDTARAAVGLVPRDRPVIWLDVADPQNGVSLNPFRRVVSRALLVDNLMSGFKSVFGDDAIQARSDQILRAGIQLVLDALPDTGTLFDVYRVLADPEYRRGLVDRTRDPMVRLTWTVDIPAMASRPGLLEEVFIAPKNKLWRFLSEEPLRRLFCGPNAIDWEEFVRERGVLIIHTPKGAAGDENVRLMGNFIVSSVCQLIQGQLARPETDRVDVAVYLDEAHNDLNRDLAATLAEGRAGGLQPVFAFQYLDQMNEAGLKDAVQSLLQSTVIFRTEKLEDGERFTKTNMWLYSNFIGVQDEVQDRLNFSVDDYLNLPMHHAICRWTQGGRLTPAFLAQTVDWRTLYDPGVAAYHIEASRRRFPACPETLFLDPAAEVRIPPPEAPGTEAVAETVEAAVEPQNPGETAAVGAPAGEPTRAAGEGRPTPAASRRKGARAAATDGPDWAEDIAARLGQVHKAAEIARTVRRQGATPAQARQAVAEMESSDRWRPDRVRDPLAVFARFLGRIVKKQR